jgi:hypothetical protein
VNFDDYVLIDLAFNTQGAALGRANGTGGANRAPRLSLSVRRYSALTRPARAGALRLRLIIWRPSWSAFGRGNQVCGLAFTLLILWG